jgi:hypothetical protein
LPKTKFDTISSANESRSINYTIFKNKGLTRKRTNQPKNGRIKYRQKYEKALIKQRSKGKVIR